MRDVRPRIDTTLDVISRQTQFVRALGILPKDAAFDQFYVRAAGAVSARIIHLHRDSSDAPDDSGWRVSLPVVEEDADDQTYEEDVLQVAPTLR